MTLAVDRAVKPQHKQTKDWGYTRTCFSGTMCPVVGRVSMDGITIKLPDEVKECREFHVIKDDFNMANSAFAIAKQTNTIPYEVCTNLDRRLPRVYIADGQIKLFNDDKE